MKNRGFFLKKSRFFQTQSKLNSILIFNSCLRQFFKINSWWNTRVFTFKE